MKEILSGWIVGVVVYLLMMTRDAYRVCYLPVRAEVSETETAMYSEQP
jgi:hypothetical protein